MKDVEIFDDLRDADESETEEDAFQVDTKVFFWKESTRFSNKNQPPHINT